MGPPSLYEVPYSSQPIKAPTVENVSRVEDVIIENHRISTKQLAAMLGISTKRVLRIRQENLNMNKVSC